MSTEEAIAKLTATITSEFNREVVRLKEEEENAAGALRYAAALESRARTGQTCAMATLTVGILDQFLADLTKPKAE